MNLVVSYNCLMSNIYVALLRGINVGGNNKVSMQTLKEVFEKAGMESVITYINSGNVIFKSKLSDPHKISEILEAAIHHQFKFNIKVVIKEMRTIKKIVETLPDSWKNDAEMKCDVMFLWNEVDKKEVIEDLTINSDIDNVKYVEGAVLWMVDKKNVTRSGIMKLVGTKLYSQMTIRNCNTARKIYSLMEGLE